MLCTTQLPKCRAGIYMSKGGHGVGLALLPGSRLCALSMIVRWMTKPFCMRHVMPRPSVQLAMPTVHVMLVLRWHYGVHASICGPCGRQQLHLLAHLELWAHICQRIIRQTWRWMPQRVHSSWGNPLHGSVRIWWGGRYEPGSCSECVQAVVP